MFATAKGVTFLILSSLGKSFKSSTEGRNTLSVTPSNSVGRIISSSSLVKAIGINSSWIYFLTALVE